MTPLAADVRAAIVVDLRAGQSQYRTAKDHGVSAKTVSLIAKAEGIPVGNVSSVKNAATARTVYNLEARQAFSDQLFEQLKLDIKNGVPTKDVIMGFAILTDKRRLEEGQATERHEYNDRSDREFVTGRVDELAARRRSRLAPDPDAESGAATAL